MVDVKKLLFNSITISLPKNVVQFSLGIILYWFFFGSLDFHLMLLALSGFLIAYSSVYIYNDMVDRAEDRKDREKLKWKLLASGHLTEGFAKILIFSFIVIGFSLSLLVNKWFFLMVLMMLLLNFLHSSPYTRFKKSLRKTTVNMTVIEFLKFSCGWFALTTDIVHFPFWVILSFSVVYTTGYLIYKFKFRGNIIKANKKLFIGLAAVGVVSYTLSLIQYGFPLAMILLIIIPLFILMFFKQMDIEFHRISNMIVIEYLLLPVVIISFLILTIPFVAQANDEIASTITVYKENVMKEIPEPIKKPIDNLSSELKKYKTLEDIEEEIKLNFKELAEPLSE